MRLTEHALDPPHQRTSDPTRAPTRHPLKAHSAPYRVIRVPRWLPQRVSKRLHSRNSQT